MRLDSPRKVAVAFVIDTLTYALLVLAFWALVYSVGTFLSTLLGL